MSMGEPGAGAELTPEIIRMLLTSAYAARRLSLDGASDDSHGRRYWRRVTNPIPGDWVFESSSFREAFRPDANPLDHFGVLLRKEPCVVMDERGKEVFVEDDYYRVIRTADGREVRWGNAEFIVIPPSPDGFPGLWD